MMKQGDTNGMRGKHVTGSPGLQQEVDRLVARGQDAAGELVELLLREAVTKKASDLHIEPLGDALHARYRIDGVLRDGALIPCSLHERLVGRIKVLADLVAYRSDIPQEGRIGSGLGLNGVELRVSTFPTIHGEKITIRILDSSQVLMQLAELGFSPQALDPFRDTILRPGGTVLLTGPSSSGKTTTMYAALCEIHEKRSAEAHIVTVEDPVEFDLGFVSQTQIRPYGELTFPRALRSLLRHDPEVIMVGEIRDPETAQIVIQAGLTGHMVISTIHSGSAAGVFTRLIEMGIEPFLVASSVSAVLAQRLVRLTCSGCRKEDGHDPQLWQHFGFEKPPAWRPARGEGCAKCDATGYLGRTAMMELLLVRGAVREAVLKRSTTGAIEEAARAGGMKTLLEDGLEKVRQGMTTMEELARILLPEERTGPV